MPADDITYKTCWAAVLARKMTTLALHIPADLFNEFWEESHSWKILSCTRDILGLWTKPRLPGAVAALPFLWAKYGVSFLPCRQGNGNRIRNPGNRTRVSCLLRLCYMISLVIITWRFSGRTASSQVSFSAVGYHSAVVFKVIFPLTGKQVS